MTIVTRPDTLLPDPEPRPVRATVISVDDHLVEPPDMFEGRLPAPLRRPGPPGRRELHGPPAVGVRRQALLAGRDERRGRSAARVRHPRADPVRGHAPRLLGHRRPHRRHGHQRGVGVPQLPVADHRVLGERVLGGRATPGWVWPSPGPGTTGCTRRGGSPIPTASSRAASPSWPTPSWAPTEIRRNAARGFRSVTLPERPQRIGLPSLFSGYWDPVVAACEETETVISLHVGSSGMPDLPPDGPLVALGATLFGQMSLTACAEWLWSGLPARFPDIRIAMSEGGIGWVAMLLDRLDNIVDRSGYGRDYDAVGPAPGRRPPAQLLVLHHRRPVHHRHPPPDRRRPHHGGGRLPPRRLDVAGHPGGHRALLGPPAGRGPPQADPRERRTPVPVAAARPPWCREPSRRSPPHRVAAARPHRRDRSSSCWPGRCGARGTTTTWPATSPTASPTGRCCATRGSCCGTSSAPTTCSGSTSTAPSWTAAGRSRSGSPSISSCTAGGPTWWSPSTATPGSPPSGPTSAGSPAATTRARPSAVASRSSSTSTTARSTRRTAAARAVASMGIGRPRPSWPTTASW